jgi:hypothetical protein
MVAQRHFVRSFKMPINWSSDVEFEMGVAAYGDNAVSSHNIFLLLLLLDYII